MIAIKSATAGSWKKCAFLNLLKDIDFHQYLVQTIVFARKDAPPEPSCFFVDDLESNEVSLVRETDFKKMASKILAGSSDS